MAAKEKGMKVIGLTSMEYTTFSADGAIAKL